MRYTENFTMAIKNLRSNLIRSLLTMLGVIIGVASVIVMVALGEGAKQQITSSITAMGSNLLMVYPNFSGRGGSFGSGTSLDNKIIPVIETCSPYIEAVAPEARSRALVKSGANSMQTSITGCTTTYLQLRNYQISSGSFFSEDDLKSKKRYAVIGSYIAEELFPEKDPVGQELKIGKVRAQIIGVLEQKGQNGASNSDDLVLVPLTTMQQKMSGNKNLSTIYVKVNDEKNMDTVNNQLYEALLAELGDESKFRIGNQAEVLATVQQTTQSFTFLLAGIAAVSLLVGGIGIMNIMLVSVTERTREIGIRKAIGAQMEEILMLFLTEAVFLSVLGGIIGILLGGGLSVLVARFSGWSTAITPASVIVSFLFSFFTGLFFGVYPAYKASGLNPIEALRHE